MAHEHSYRPREDGVWTYLLDRWSPGWFNPAMPLGVME